MTPTSSEQNYTNLLIQYQPKPIKTPEEYNVALTIVEEMMSGELTEAETTLFDLLVVLIETYEVQHYPIGEPTATATLESLMHEFDVRPSTLAEVIGSVEQVSKIINGQREVSTSQAESLAKFFNDLSSELSLTSKHFGK
ncbi:MAG: helix-turn-helix domain-containing protein [Calothrix sp. MO_167.B12]|nr:helix-turn-helix domain-containing protein [Calothrix sp. MO_167.B12]